MRMLLLAVAATAIAVPAPAQAQNMSAALSLSSENSRHHRDDGPRFRGVGSGQFQGCDLRGGGRDRRSRRGGACDISVGTVHYGGEWALYNNRSWESDSYNDWWHDRPDRAYPRWMSSNPNCQRMWWSGGGWRC